MSSNSGVSAGLCETDDQRTLFHILDEMRAHLLLPGALPRLEVTGGLSVRDRAIHC